MRRAAPFLLLLAELALWEAIVRLRHVPVYRVPGPVAIATAFAADPLGLLAALLSTLVVTAAALAGSAALGALLAVLVALSPLARAAIAPWAVILQVTPLVAIAPLIIVWVGDPFAALVVCAVVVAFFPVYSSTVTGLAAPRADQLDLFALYGASRWDIVRRLRVPVALPYFLSGLRITGGLALVGAVVAEFVAGSGGIASGLAFRILESGYRLQIPRMFACLALLSMAGLAIYFGLAWLSRAVLRARGDA